MTSQDVVDRMNRATAAKLEAESRLLDSLARYYDTKAKPFVDEAATAASRAGLTTLQDYYSVSGPKLDWDRPEELAAAQLKASQETVGYLKELNRKLNTLSS